MLINLEIAQSAIWKNYWLKYLALRLIKTEDGYRGSIEKLLTTVISGASVAGGTAAPAAVATPGATVAAPPERSADVVAKNLATLKVDEIENEMEARNLRLRMEKTIALMKRKFPNG